MCETFLAAWHGPDRAEYWANIGKYLILWDLDWTVPINDTERTRYETMLVCYDRARELDPSITIPENEIRDARELLEHRDPIALPRPDRPGYRRRMMHRSLHYGWSAEIPGYFRRVHDTEENKEHNYFWFGGREVHFTVLGFDSVEGGTTARDYVLQHTEPKDEETVFGFTLRRDWLAGRAVVRKSNDHWTVQAMYGVTSKGEHIILVLTLVHEDTRGGQDWAKTLLESVSHPTPEPN